jgi:predicted O-methyltransferase YrrM
MTSSIRSPRTALRILERGFRHVDRVYDVQSSWTFGTLPRLPFRTIFPQSASFDLQLVRAYDRQWGTSVTLEELCCLLLVAKSVHATNVLEIGTWDGNTAVNLAANTSGMVTTLDLPPDFVPDELKSTLFYPDIKPNLTDRAQLGRQFKDHPLTSRIRQVFGDSARLDWTILGPPFDLVFIDGCHHYPYVKSDTENARAHLRSGGAIAWHDYGMVADVSRLVDEVARTAEELSVYAIEATRLAVGIKTKQ